ncbi:MAG: hypothetical protein HY901_04120 [Deltaproteobacteria bacterium]|nr:hypothetical protein [Deltaproteobacteria bacterium]
MSRRILLAVFGALALWASPGVVRADHYFVFPQVGIGYGRLLEDDFTAWVGKLDLTLGQEYDLGGPRAAVGWMLDFGLAGNVIDEEDRSPPPQYWRFEFAPMLTLSSGYNWWTLFARVGIGPHFSYAKRGDVAALGGGMQVDLAVGSKNAIELFTQAFATVDGRGPNVSVLGGIRLNAIAFVALMDLMSGRSPRVSTPRVPKVHRAVPVH